ncbi:MAG: hypothetical protein M1833_005228 [Piccolia ochrophora]|nr:MAG: hypothetical protein M1833_005228 [Piccolia ochrophora]
MKSQDWGVENTLRTIFRRCVVCEKKTPMCPPSCPSGFTCGLSAETCTECASMICVPETSSMASSQKTSGPTKRGANIGAIAGGVIGGVVLVTVVVWLLWRFFLKKRRQEFEAEEWPEEESFETEEKTDDFNRRRDDRASTHTVGSIASTVLTRASNIIQIAYIPGVTNRSPPSTPGLLVPPVPPLPLMTNPNSAATTPDYAQDQHFFMPDLRDSTYSGVSDSSYARDSVAPSLARSSVATSIYRSNAVPAQTVIRGKAAVVSVKSSSPNSPSQSRSPTPPLPSTDFAKYEQFGRPPPSPAFSVGSTFLNSTANTAKAVTARPITVKKPSKSSLGSGSDTTIREVTPNRSQRPPLSASTSVASRHSRARRQNVDSSVYDDVTSDEEDEPGSRARRSFANSRGEPLVNLADESPSPRQSPFSDRSAISPVSKHALPSFNTAQPSGKSNLATNQQSNILSSVIEEATRKASQQPTHNWLGSRGREVSPFSDANEVRGP